MKYNIETKLSTAVDDTNPIVNNPNIHITPTGWVRINGHTVGLILEVPTSNIPESYRAYTLHRQAAALNPGGFHHTLAEAVNNVLSLTVNVRLTVSD